MTASLIWFLSSTPRCLVCPVVQIFLTYDIKAPNRWASAKNKYSVFLIFFSWLEFSEGKPPSCKQQLHSGSRAVNRYKTNSTTCDDGLKAPAAHALRCPLAQACGKGVVSPFPHNDSNNKCSGILTIYPQFSPCIEREE